jgi:thioester reductase-like protein
LGAFLLKQLLDDQPQATIHCIVRAKNDKDAMSRIIQHLINFLLWKNGDEEKYKGRIIAIAGDLSVPKCGLSDEAFDHLARKIDVILHNGAQVNWILPYSTLKKTNVDGKIII